MINQKMSILMLEGDEYPQLYVELFVEASLTNKSTNSNFLGIRFNFPSKFVNVRNVR